MKNSNSYNLALELSKEQQSHLVCYKHEREIFLPYSDLGQIAKCVRLILDLTVGQYNRISGGYVVAYGDVKLCSPLAMVSDSSLFFRFKVFLNEILFSPKRGDVMEGIVTFIDEGQIACCVYGAVAVSIWRKTKMKAPNVGDIVRFNVVDIRAHHKVLQLIGTFVSSRKWSSDDSKTAYTAKIDFTDMNGESEPKRKMGTAESHSKAKRHKKKKR